MNMNRKKLFLAALLLLTTRFAFAQDMMTVDTAIKIILKNNFSILVSRNITEIARNNNIPGNAGMLPQLSLNASGNSANNNLKQRLSNGTDIEKDNVGA